MDASKTIALVAHDNRKAALMEWVSYNWATLICHKIVCTGTTGRLVEETITRMAGGKRPDELDMRRLKSGPLGGDQQLGALISDGAIDAVIFFWDPMSPQPHDVDIKALLRIAVLYDVPMACNRSTADFVISSPLMHKEYTPMPLDLTDYIDRKIL